MPRQEVGPVKVDVPDGFWELEANENPQPISPMAESFFLEALTSGARHVFAELGILAEAAEWRAIGSWVYLRTIPFAGDEQAVAERLGRAHDAVTTDLAGRYLQRWEEEWRPWLLRRRDELGRVDLTALDHPALDDHVQEAVGFLLAATDVHMLLHASNALMLGELTFACRDLLGWSEQQVFDLVSGLSPASTEPAQHLARLAEMARSRPAVRALLDDAANAVAKLGAADPEFAAAFERYRRDFGDRAVRYEVIDPTIGECPELVLRLVRDQIARPYDPAAVAARVASRQAETRAAARATLAEQHPAQRDRFERLLARAERFYPVREDNEVWTQSVPLALVRRALLEVGRRLVDAGTVTEVDDVFLLTLGEARQALAGGSGDLAGLLGSRRAERAWALAHPGPASYGRPPDRPDFSALPPAAAFVHEATAWCIDRILSPAANACRRDSDVIEGIAASSGRYTGLARIVRHEGELDKVQPDDVLVCPATSPAWSPVFPSIGALVTDTGGILSHAAIIAREFAIPAVVATGNATDVFADGQIITVDGDAGRVDAK
jgi:phosphohistidine swiveling domain-containing protein